MSTRFDEQGDEVAVALLCGDVKGGGAILISGGSDE